MGFGWKSNSSALQDLIMKNLSEKIDFDEFQGRVKSKTIGDFKAVTLVSPVDDPDVKFFVGETVSVDSITEEAVKVGVRAYEGYTRLLEGILLHDSAGYVSGDLVKIRSIIKKMRQYKVYPVIVVKVGEDTMGYYGAIEFKFAHLPDLRKLTKTADDVFPHEEPIVWDRVFVEYKFTLTKPKEGDYYFSVVHTLENPKKVYSMLGTDFKVITEVFDLIEKFMQVTVNMLSVDPEKAGIKNQFFHTIFNEFDFTNLNVVLTYNVKQLLTGNVGQRMAGEERASSIKTTVIVSLVTKYGKVLVELVGTDVKEGKSFRSSDNVAPSCYSAFKDFNMKLITKFVYWKGMKGLLGKKK